MVINEIDSLQFRLNSLHDFTWLKKYGTAFWVVDETGSGCIGIGMDKDGKKYFCKIAGVDTVESDVSIEESVVILKQAVSMYYELAHPNLIRIVEEFDYNRFYVVIFEWADGECLFDHWNFGRYREDPRLKSPKDRFMELSVGKKLNAVDTIFSFLLNVNRKGYVAVDFYDGSIMYDFTSDSITFCDIDLFRKAPVINDKGADWFGTKRLKAPEEYMEGGVIDEQTNIFTLGALIFDFLGGFSEEDIQSRYHNNQFTPCSFPNWLLNKESYQVALKAVSMDKGERYSTFQEFWEEWKSALM